MGFLSKLMGVEAKHALQAVSDHVVGLDTKSATIAQLELKEEAMSRVGTELAKFKMEAQREQGEVLKIQTNYNRLSAAADKLANDAEAETDPVRKDALNASFNGLFETVNKLKSDLDIETKNKADADSLVAETETIFQEKSAELMADRKTLENAARDMNRAKVDEQHTAMMAERAASLAGLRNDQVDGLNGALSAMQRQTDNAKIKAEANRMKADALSHVDAGSVSDPNVAAALASLAGTNSGGLSPKERMAALKSH